MSKNCGKSLRLHLLMFFFLFSPQTKVIQFKIIKQNKTALITGKCKVYET